jgi:WXG100 family type VII secretion target
VAVQQQNVGTTQEGMAAARVEFEGKVQIFNGQLSSVNQEMAVLQSTWDGTASSNFNQAMDNWEGGFKRVITALISMIESLGGNAKLYEGQEDTASNLAQQWGQALGNGVQDTPVAAPSGGLPGL